MNKRVIYLYFTSNYINCVILLYNNCVYISYRIIYEVSNGIISVCVCLHIGFLLCKYDQLCVHSDDICDGIINCLYGGDDERLCDVKICPHHCICIDTIVSCVNSTGSFKTDDIPSNAMVIILTHIAITIKPNMFVKMNKLMSLYMSGCFFHRIYILHTMFIELFSLKILDLSFTNVRYLPSYVFEPLINLKSIILTACKISQLDPYIFPEACHLQTLNMKTMSIKTLQSYAFCKLFHLIELDISHNFITQINEGTFNCLRNLNILNISHNRVMYIDTTINKHIYSIKFVYVDAISQCCHITLAATVCVPRNDNFQHRRHMCQNILLDSNMLRYGYLFIGIFIITLALSSAVCKRFSKQQQKNTVICTNLLLSDSLIGWYFLLIYIINIYYGNQFIKLNDPHLIGLTCRFVGILPVLSTVMSNTLYCLGIVQQLLVTKYYFAKKYIDIYSVRNQQTLLTVIWLTWLCVVILYLLLATPDSLLCFVPYTVHRNYFITTMTVLIFIIYGGLAFASSCILYVLIIRHVITVVHIYNNTSRENVIVMRVVQKTVLVMASHFISWVSTSVVISVALGIDNKDAYVSKLLLCCSMPLNAISNPFIYTILPLLKTSH